MATALLSGCSDDPDDHRDAAGSGGSGSGASSTGQGAGPASGTGGAGTGGAGSGGGSTGGFATCLESMQVIDADCSDAPSGTIEWVGWGAGRCMGSAGSSLGYARFLMSLAEVDPEGNPTVTGVRLEPQTGHDPTSDDQVAFTSGSPHLVTPGAPLPANLTGSATVEPMLFGGGLGFLLAASSDATVTLDSPLGLDALMDGGEVRGSFRLVGGTFTLLDGTQKVDVPDPQGEVVGCFAVPYELYAVELDDP